MNADINPLNSIREALYNLVNAPIHSVTTPDSATRTGALEQIDSIMRMIVDYGETEHDRGSAMGEMMGENEVVREIMDDFEEWMDVLIKFIDNAIENNPESKPALAVVKHRVEYARYQMVEKWV